MGDSALYDEDILRWSERQAEIVRGLARVRGIPNDLDIANVAEEIESVGRSELAAVESFIELILAHLVKLSLEPDAQAARKWRSEIIAFHGNMRRRYADSMRGRIAFDEIWRQVRAQAIVAAEDGAAVAALLPERSPVDLDELLAERLDTAHARFVDLGKARSR